jgi:hypothetical protein
VTAAASAEVARLGADLQTLTAEVAAWHADPAAVGPVFWRVGVMRGRLAVIESEARATTRGPGPGTNPGA